jgi:nucleolar protein 16
LNALDSDEEDEEEEEEEEEDAWEGVEEEDEKTQLLKELEWQANNPAEKTPRHQSEREREWLGRLVEQHGDDYGRMARDHKLNPMQQTAADIKRRIRKMQKMQK